MAGWVVLFACVAGAALACASWYDGYAQGLSEGRRMQAATIRAMDAGNDACHPCEPCRCMWHWASCDPCQRHRGHEAEEEVRDDAV